MKLRRQHRIIGATIGCTPTLPRQEVLHGLPLMLMPEEVTLLLETKIARLIEYPCLRQEPDDDLKKVFEEHRRRLFAEQDECLKEGKRLQVCRPLQFYYSSGIQTQSILDTWKNRIHCRGEETQDIGVENFEKVYEEVLGR